MLYYFSQPLRIPCVDRLCRGLLDRLLTREKTPSPPSAFRRRKGKEKGSFSRAIEPN